MVLTPNSISLAIDKDQNIKENAKCSEHSQNKSNKIILFFLKKEESLEMNGRHSQWICVCIIERERESRGGRGGGTENERDVCMGVISFGSFTCCFQS